VRLKGDVAVVTGAAQGLGLRMAEQLAAEGADVVLADVQEVGAKLDAWPRELRERAWAIRTDVREAGQVRALMERVESERGGLDILVNNASLFTSLARKPFFELEPEDWERSLSVNVLGTFLCTKEAYPLLKRRGGGRIVNVASDAVFKGLPMLLDYVAAKGAIVAMTRALARELGADEIRVNAIAPGLTRHEASGDWDEARDAIVVERRCLRRTQIPEDVCGALVFLASADSGFVTGQTLVVDGGEVVR